MTDTSLTLLNKLRADDNQAWGRFIERYRTFLFGYLKNFGVPAADADDLVQEVLITLRRELPRFDRLRTGSLRAWLRETMRLRCLEFVRRRNRNETFAALEEISGGLAKEHSHFSRRWDEEHEKFILERIFQDIEPRFAPETWQAFRRVTTGESLDKVATSLGMSANAVRIAKSRVQAALREAAAEFLD